MDQQVLLMALGVGLTAALALMGVAQMVRTPRIDLSQRISSVAEASPYVSGRVGMLRDRRASRFFLLDAWLQTRDWTGETQLKLERAGLRLRVGEYVLLRAFMATAGGFIGAFMPLQLGLGRLAIITMVVGGLIGIMLPPLFIRWRIKRRSAKIETQLVEMCELMASMLTAGFGYLQTLSSASEQLESPLADELRRLVDAVRIGGDTDEALEQMRERLGSRDFEMVSTAIAINRATGGDLAGILRGVAETIRDRQSFVREVNALTAREKYSALVVAGFPFIIAGGLMLMLPDVFPVLYTETAGRIILGVAVAMDVVGYLAIKRVARIEV